MYNQHDWLWHKLAYTGVDLVLPSSIPTVTNLVLASAKFASKK